jgi:membrane fusion protein (multidrug efflux system)
MAKRLIIMLLAVALVFGGIFAFQTFKSKMIGQAMAALSNPPQAVSTITASSQEWSSDVEGVGSLRAVNGANVSGQVAGIVSGIHFDSGADVKKGDLLVELLATDDLAKLNALKATAELARVTYERDKKIENSPAIAKQTVDADFWTLKNDQALVDQQQALVEYKSIKAPFDGRLGIRQVDLGQYIAAGTTIVTLQQLDPIYVDLYVPEQAVATLKIGQAVTARVDAYPGLTFNGKLSAINSLVDTSTRNVQVRATISNPDGKLLPGMFARVAVDVGTPNSYVTLPQTAIAFNSYGNIAYVIKDKGKDKDDRPQLVATQIFVTTGATRGDQVAVLSGVKEGDIVVTAGQGKLRNGTRVLVNNAVQPGNDPNPRPVQD